MAKLIYTAFLADARNKLNGNVLSKNRYGAYVRNKVTPVNPRTAGQQAQRQRLGSLSSQWRELTEAQRDTWAAAVSAFPIMDIFGKPQELSGASLYVALNAPLLEDGQPINQTAPVPIDIETISIANLTADSATQTITFDVPENVQLTEFKISAFATPGLSPGKSFVKGNYRLLNNFSSNTDPLDISSYWIAKFGALVAGQKISVRARLLAIGTGQLGVPVSGSVIVS